MSKGKVLALVPARSGSKRVPFKNFKKLLGRTLLERSVDAALSCKDIDLVVVSTDREDLARSTLQFSDKIKIQKRSEKASGDHATAFDVIEEVLKEFPGFDYLIYLQPTSPLRTASDIEKSLSSFLKNSFDNLVSVSPVSSSLMFSITKNPDGTAHFLFPESLKQRSQDLAAIYALNGAIYISKTETLLKEKNFFSGRVGTYEMGEGQSLDIDNESDWKRAEEILGSDTR